MIRILLADDYTIIRKGVRQILMQAYPTAEIEEIEEEDEVDELDVDEVSSDGWRDRASQEV